MLTNAIERYIELRRVVGYKFRNGAYQLRAFGRFATEHGDTHVRSATVLDWAAGGPSPHARHVRMRHAVGFARFLHAEDPEHEVPPRDAFSVPERRPLPYIYSDDEIGRLIAAAGRLRVAAAYPLRREIYTTLVGLIAATGLRLSEALDLNVNDVLTSGVLSIRNTKFKKSRLVPVHSTTLDALTAYISLRCRVMANSDHLFLSAGGKRISSSVVTKSFHRLLVLANIAPTRPKRPRVHDLRHTFATKALERCPSNRRVIARHLVALSAYLGHADPRATQWYLEATPILMTDISSAAEALMWGGRP